MKNKTINNKAYFERMLKQLEDRKRKAVPGTLHIAKRDGFTEYYQYTRSDGRKTRKYLGVKPNDLIRKLATQAYDKKLEKFIKNKLKRLNSNRSEYKMKSIDEVFYSFNDSWQSLITPIIPTKSQKIQIWQNTPYTKKQFRTDDRSKIYTRRGERVRSKSEKILADMFYAAGIAYKYECPLVLAGGNVIHPDFTFLDPKTGREIYWEHFGMMGDPEYRARAFQRIDTYQKNGIILGLNLIVTFESSGNNLDLETAERLMKERLI